MAPTVSFDTDPGRYRHWTLSVEPPVATLTLAVDAAGGLVDDYELKLNSYDLAVDIELHDAVQRLRFEHPEVRVVVLTGGLDRVFCAGANIQMLAGASHGHKVNFCKFTNETRNAIEQASTRSGQVWLAAVNGTAAGGGYELALACDEILLVDDRASTVSLPEVPLLAVLPGTGGLTRVVDKRKVRRDLADLFATRAQGVRGRTALDWGLVDHLAPPSGFASLVAERAAVRAASSDRPADGPGLSLGPLEVTGAADGLTYRHVTVELDPDRRAATITVTGPDDDQPSTPDQLLARGDGAWLVAAARELDDAALRLRFNHPILGTWVLRTRGGGTREVGTSPSDAMAAAEAVLAHDHWLTREVRLLWARVLQRLELSSRSLVALVDPGSCCVGTLAELALVADRSYLLAGTWEDGADGDVDLPAAAVRLTAANTGWYPTVTGLSRLQARFWGHDEALARAEALVGWDLPADRALAAGLVTATPDDLDWPDEIRLVLEERAAFSPDALTAMEANLRFVGPETLESKIFGRLTAWQNWVFQRPNAVGPAGALRRYGTGSRPDYDRARV